MPFVGGSVVAGRTNSSILGCSQTICAKRAEKPPEAIAKPNGHLEDANPFLVATLCDEYPMVAK